MTGSSLNDEWGIGAQHALYHREGTWYQNLTRFPGALCDPHGYVRFETEHAYLHSPYVRVTQETNVPGGISSLPDYVLVRE
jgi:hypothetical protein